MTVELSIITVAATTVTRIIIYVQDVNFTVCATPEFCEVIKSFKQLTLKDVRSL